MLGLAADVSARLRCAATPLREIAARRSVSSLALATWEKAEQTPAVLDLAIGQPALSLLPMEAVQDGAARLSTYDTRHILQYGAPVGSEHYLSALASFLTAQLHYPHDPSTLFATVGNSGGLALVIRTLTTPGDTVLMEEPSYFLAHKLFRDYDCTFQPVRQRMDGVGTIDVEALGERLLSLSASTSNTAMPRLLYCIPTGNNPTGATMLDGDRARLVALCAQVRPPPTAPQASPQPPHGLLTASPQPAHTPHKPCKPWRSCRLDVPPRPTLLMVRSTG